MARKKPGWDAESVRALRRHLQLTQDQLAEVLGVRQQTVSEWETGLHAPRGAGGRMLTIVADEAAYAYRADADTPAEEAQGGARPRADGDANHQDGHADRDAGGA